MAVRARAGVERQRVGPLLSQLPRWGATLGAGFLSSGSSWAEQIAAWQQLTGIPVRVTRAWNGEGFFGYNAGLQELVAAGVKICLTWRPALTYNPAHAASMAGSLARMRADDADVIMNLWHEPYWHGVDAAAFVSMFRAYSAWIREFYPLYACFSGPDTILSNRFYPGHKYVDGVAVDAYLGGGAGELATTQNYVLAAQSIADDGGLPLGLWEYGAAFDLGLDPPVSAATRANVTTYFRWLQEVFERRLAHGKPNGDMIWFNTGSDSTSSFWGSALSQQGGFEGGLGTWLNGAATIGHTSAQSRSFGSAATITATGSFGSIHSSLAGDGPTQMPVTPGQRIAASGWFRAATAGRACNLRASFYDSTGVAGPGFRGASVTDNTSGWVMASLSGIVPAGAVRCRLAAVVNGMATGEVHYFDDPQLGRIHTPYNITSPIQYPWDYRIPLISAHQRAGGWQD